MNSDPILLELIDLIYEAARRPDAWPKFLERFAEAVHAPSASVQTQRGQPPCVHGYAVGREECFLRSFRDHYAAIEPRAPYMRSLSVGSVRTSQQLLSAEEFEQTEFYNDWERPQGLYHGMVGIVGNDGRDELALLEADRPTSDGEFCEEELELMRALLPHVRRAMSFNVELVGLRAEREVRAGLLEGLPVGVLWVDDRHRVVYANTSGERILGEGDGLALVDECLCAATDRESATLLASIDRAIVAGRESAPQLAATPLELTRAAGRRPLSVVVKSAAQPISAWGRPRVIAVVLVSDGNGRGAFLRDGLRSLFGLTKAEAELCLLLLEGRNLSEAAAHRGVRISTTRSQLKRILAKTGTRRQADLVRLLLTHPSFAQA